MPLNLRKVFADHAINCEKDLENMDKIIAVISALKDPEKKAETNNKINSIETRLGDNDKLKLSIKSSLEYNDAAKVLALRALDQYTEYLSSFMQKLRYQPTPKFQPPRK